MIKLSQIFVIKKCAEYVRNKGNSEPNQVYNSIEDDFDDYDK